jgi:hypothetical protein
MRIALLAIAAAFVSASAAYAAVDSFNPQPDPPGRHKETREKICHDAAGRVVKCAPVVAVCHDVTGKIIPCPHPG